jgi:hypothetical protein
VLKKFSATPLLTIGANTQHIDYERVWLEHLKGGETPGADEGNCNPQRPHVCRSCSVVALSMAAHACGCCER